MKVQLTIPDMLGPVVQKYRKRRGISADTVAEHLGCSSHHYSTIENNHTKPGYPALVEIIRYLGVNPEEIFFPEQVFAEADSKRAQLLHLLQICSDDRIDIMMAIWNGLPEDKKRCKVENENSRADNN